MCPCTPDPQTFPFRATNAGGSRTMRGGRVCHYSATVRSEHRRRARALRGTPATAVPRACSPKAWDPTPGGPTPAIRCAPAGLELELRYFRVHEGPPHRRAPPRSRRPGRLQEAGAPEATQGRRARPHQLSGARGRRLPEQPLSQQRARRGCGPGELPCRPHAAPRPHRAPVPTSPRPWRRGRETAGIRPPPGRPRPPPPAPHPRAAWPPGTATVAARARHACRRST